MTERDCSLIKNLTFDGTPGELREYFPDLKETGDMEEVDAQVENGVYIYHYQSICFVRIVGKCPNWNGQACNLGPKCVSNARQGLASASKAVETT